MKYLQDLVPGCNKVTGKAGMLDEIINYVQSLQKQVEFLSMKLATLNPRLDLNTDNIFVKDLPSYMTTTFPPTVAVPTLSEYNMIQHQQAGSTGDVAQMLPQRRDLMSFPDTYLGSSHVTVITQLILIISESHFLVIFNWICYCSIAGSTTATTNF